MSGVAVVADSASDLSSLSRPQPAGITVVPLLVTFGDKEYQAGVDMSAEEFWAELTAPGAPFPKTAAAAPGTFKETFDRLFAEGADEIVYVGVGSKLSATLGSAKVAREMMPERKIHIVDSNTASMGAGLLALYAAEKAAAGNVGRARSSPTVTAKRRADPPVRGAGDARVPEARRSDQPGTGRDRQRPVGQADHHRRGRRRRNRRPAAHARPGPRTPDRAAGRDQAGAGRGAPRPGGRTSTTFADELAEGDEGAARQDDAST